MGDQQPSGLAAKCQTKYPGHLKQAHSPIFRHIVPFPPKVPSSETAEDESPLGTLTAESISNRSLLCCILVLFVAIAVKFRLTTAVPAPCKVALLRADLCCGSLGNISPCSTDQHWGNARGLCWRVPVLRTHLPASCWWCSSGRNH